ncbi:MAG: hypothetical protein IJU44_01065 [Kiritimatiellae bacterium]|nr:hypothetical protein [Kiritimatiellia bacterium]
MAISRTPDSTALRHRKNIVGYTKKASVSGFNWLAPQFSTVGATTVDLKDITLTGDGVGNGGESLAILDEGGAPVGDPYVFWSKDVTGEENDCWFDFNEWAPITGVSFALGDGVMISAGDGINYTVAGEVPKVNVEFVTIDGFNFTGNPFPSDIDLQNIVLSGDGVGNGGESLAVLDEGGAPIGDPYVFWSKDVTGEENDCWFDFNEWVPITGVTIGGGDGVLLSAAAGVTVTIKVPYTM